jgi:hypothetical protein
MSKSKQGATELRSEYRERMKEGLVSKTEPRWLNPLVWTVAVGAWICFLADSCIDGYDDTPRQIVIWAWGIVATLGIPFCVFVFWSMYKQSGTPNSSRQRRF